MLLLVYVDDVLVTGSSAELIARTKSDLKTRFEITDSGVGGAEEVEEVGAKSLRGGEPKRRHLS